MAPLVDYSSDSSESGETVAAGPPPSKKQKTELPPLPSAFHDLYASTVRVSASDDPTLHQGRKRVNPHKAGHWPTHLYIEWHPTTTERETLTTLLTTLQSKLPLSPSSSTPLTTFLTSDLGTPQPLHISLSRPIVLSTSQKDDFTTEVSTSFRSASIAPFSLTPTGLSWHRAAESARSFLVLHVCELTRNEETDNTKNATTGMKNPSLTTLLRRANALVVARGQPALYASSSSSSSSSESSSSNNDASAAVAVVDDDAFHVSIAWSLSSTAPDVALQRLTDEVFDSMYTGNDNNTEDSLDTGRSKEDNDHQGQRDEKEEDDDDDDSGEEKKETKEEGRRRKEMVTFRDAVDKIRLRVDGVKVKVGNVVTHVPLPEARRRWAEDGVGAGGVGEKKSHGIFGV